MQKNYFAESFSKFFAAILLSVISFITISAQSEAGSASIEGTITDANGAVVQGASVNIKNSETGLERNVVTNERGHFSASVLPVGVYTVTVTAKGFAVIPVETKLTVGVTTPVDIVLAPEGASALVDVVADGEILDTEQTAAGSTINEKAISDLPIRGRNYTEFVQLSPAVVQEGDRSGLVISGQRSINSNVAVDGADFNDSLQGNQRGGSEAVFTFPQTAIREFQVVRSGATAEVGRTNAGFVNAVTKSGTNETRGEVFYFNRNDKLSSPDAFGFDGNNQQNQFGGSIGGAIKRDRAFYFFGIEQNYLKIPYFVDFTEAASVTLPSQLAALEGEQISTNDPTSLFGRLDFNLNQNNTLNFQYTYSRLTGENFGAYDEGLTRTDRANAFKRTQNSNGLKSSLVTVFGANVVNEFRAQWATDNRLQAGNIEGPEFRISGIGRFGGENSHPRDFNTTRWQVSDNLSWNVGKHHLKFGTDININRFNARRIPAFQGIWRFDTVQTFLNNIPRRYEQTVVLQPENSTARSYTKEYALFVTDKVKITKDFTLTAGLRWEGQDNPTPPNPNPAFPQTTLIPDDWNQWQPRLGASWDVGGKGDTVIRFSSGIYTARTPSTLFIRPFVENGLVSQYVRIDERSGGSCRTSPTATNCILRRNPDGTIGSNFAIDLPNVLTTAPAAYVSPARQRIFGFEENFKNPRSFQGSITVEQKIGEDFVASVGFIRSATWNLQRRVDRNLAPPVLDQYGFPNYSNPRPDPRVGRLSINESSAHSDYNALTLSLRRRFADRFQMEANYTFARNRDDDSNERNFDRETTLYFFDLKREAGYSKQDVRHNFNLSGLVNLGYGFTLSGILLTRSGFPYTALLDDDYNNDGNEDNDRAVIDGVVAPRNSLRQPNFFNLDLRLLKAFNFGEKYKLSLSAEVFNVTRAKNLGYGADAISEVCTADATQKTTSPVLNVTCPTGTVPSALGGIPFTAPSTARFGGPRQLQLGIKFSF